MASKKKNKPKSRARSAKKKPKAATKSKISRKSARKKPAKRKIASRTKISSRKKKPSVSAETELRREFGSRSRASSGVVPPRRSEDFEGLSRAEEADSESVDELVEEGNVFEAGAVEGVEEADSSDEREVHTHEVPEDDVPEEYLDKD